MLKGTVAIVTGSTGGIAAQKHISREDATRELLAAKQPSLDFVSPTQRGVTVAFPVLGCGRPDHRRGNLGRWWLDRTVAGDG